jgi:hypothetical protein
MIFGVDRSQWKKNTMQFYTESHSDVIKSNQELVSGQFLNVPLL